MATNQPGFCCTDPNCPYCGGTGEIDPEMEPRCHTCGGDGWVDSVVAESGRWGWDEDAPGECPNCGGSGLKKDCQTF